ncbi:MAG: hypothetical protein FWF94_04760 [Oscillospiraceae bacterium]|nr:hypothetical protein [Oscillospiraceae bacterium]
MVDLNKFIPPVRIELIPIKNLVSNQVYQRHLSLRHIQRMVSDFYLYQINPVKISYRDNLYYVINGQHTIEVIAAVSESRETPVWCMIYDDLNYEQEAHIFANQQRYQNQLSSYDLFNADIEAGDDNSIIIKELVESYGLKITPKHGVCSIGAVNCLLRIYNKYGYHVLDRTLRLTVGTWEGVPQSLAASVLRGIAHIIVTFGDSLKDDRFIQCLSKISALEIIRDAKARNSGIVGYSEIILINYNKGKQKGLPMGLLHDKKINC